MNRISRIGAMSALLLTTSASWAADVNDDGRDDILIGRPGGSQVAFALGTAGGLVTSEDNMLSYGDVFDDDWVHGKDYEYGAAVAFGDFNGDGIEDFVVGAPGMPGAGATGQSELDPLTGFSSWQWDPGTPLAVGMAHVVYMAPPGQGWPHEVWDPSTPGVPGAPEADDRFGASVAVGDFDGDGYDDLVIGVPGEDIGQTPDAGAVVVLYGSQDGLTTDGAADFWQDGPGMLGVSEADDRFGESLAVGDFDRDGYDDLAVGVPGENGDKGLVHLIYGTAAGLDATGDALYYPGWNGVGGTWDAGDEFGAALTVGDFNLDGTDDLAIGAPGFGDDGGKVHVIFGEPDLFGVPLGGLNAGAHAVTEDQILSQNVGSIRSSREAGDRFGAALEAADLNGDGYDDLAVGVPGENIAGAVAILYGGSGGIVTGGGDHLLVCPFASPSDSDLRNYASFGAAIRSGDFDGDGRVDLAIGAPEFHTMASARGYKSHGGAVWAAMGTANGPVIDWTPGEWLGFLSAMPTWFEFGAAID